MALQDSKGTTLECLREFSINNGFQNVSRKDAPRRKRLCIFLGINPQETGRKWFDNFTLPTGVNLIKLQILLELMGYVVVEREKASRFARRVGDHLVFLKLLPKDLATQVGVQDNAVMNWTTGQIPMDDKMAKIEEVLQSNEAKVQAARQTWTDAFHQLELIPAPVLKVAQAVSKTRAKNHSEFVLATLKKMEALIVDIKRIGSAEFTIDDREIFLRSDVTEKLIEAVDTLNFKALSENRPEHALSA